MWMVTILLLSLFVRVQIVRASSGDEKSGKKKTVVSEKDTTNPDLWIERNIDDMEDDTTYSSRYYLVIANESKKKGLKILLRRYPEYGFYWATFYVFGSRGCVDEKSRIIIMYDDQTKIDVSGDHDFDAETYLTKNISKIRVYTKNGYVEEKLTPDQAREFRIVLKHLSQAVK
jgi:hypothetical protein